MDDEVRLKLVGVHKPGSIRRMKLTNFLTYHDVEMRPGARLNVVVGPNGTGKSTILCAFCLGLGGEPKLLGRADDARLFIMHDKDMAVIEIQLEPFEDGEIHVLKRTIERNKGGQNGRGASTFYINGNKVTAKELRKLVTKTYHISVDNLCTFLPQDRVGNFSGFGPQDLLVETEKSMSGSGHLYETHQTLVEMEAELKRGGGEVETIRAKLKRLEADNERLEREKERMEEREEAERQLMLLSYKHLWLKFDAARDEALRLKNEKHAARARLSEEQQKLEPLQVAYSDLVTKKKRYDDRYKTLDNNMKKSLNQREKQEAKAKNHVDEIDQALCDLNAMDSESRQAAAKVEQAREKVEQLQAEMVDLPSKDSVEQAQKEAVEEVRQCRPSFENAKRELARATAAFKEKQQEKDNMVSKLARMNDEKVQRKEKVFQYFREIRRISEWLDQNRNRFRRPVWGPIACEIAIRSTNAAAFLEHHVPNATLKSFVVEDKKDYDLLYQEVRQGLRLPINVLLVPNGKLQETERPYSADKMRILREEHGISGVLEDSFTAPDAILQALRNAARVNRVLVGATKTQASIDNKGLLDLLSQPEVAGQGLRPYTVFASKGDRSFRYTANVSRYSKKVAMSQDELRLPKLLTPGVNPEHKRKLEAEIHNMNEELLEMERSHVELRARKDDLEKQTQEAQGRLRHAKEAQKAITKHQQRLSAAKRRLKEAEDRAVSDNTDEKMKLVRKIQARMKSTITALDAHADQQKQIMQSTFSSAGLRINQDVMAAAVRRADDSLKEAERGFRDAENALKNISRRFTEKKNRLREAKTLAERDAPLEDADGNPLPLKAELEALSVSTLAETEAAIDEASAKVNGIDANPDIIRQYEERKAEIKLIRDQLSDLTESKDSKVAELEKVKLPWEQALQNSVTKVNVLFSKYMAELGCAGEVKLTTGVDDRRRSDEVNASPGNFKDWGILIRVKFREASKLQALSARVQSGGERSLSTIMYLMALQELMVSPFRCVDEINQGLDDRNERLVFKRIVENSTKPPRNGVLTAHAGQYFLITPKLLPNMMEMENEAITTQCIMNGPFSFEAPLDWAKIFENSEEGDENSASSVNEGRARKQRRLS